jgi:RHS repeat-associated protein
MHGVDRTPLADAPRRLVWKRRESSGRPRMSRVGAAARGALRTAAAALCVTTPLPVARAVGGSACGAGGDGASDVVYQWTAPAPGSYAIRVVTHKSGSDPLRSVQDGSWTGPEIVCKDPATGTAIFSYRTKEEGGTEEAELVIEYGAAAGGQPVLDFIIPAPNSGSISYDGTGGPLVGTNVTVDRVVGIDTPLHPNETRNCVSCSLSFVTGSFAGYDSWTWQFGSGGWITLTGGIDLDDDGAIGAGDIPLGTVILSGLFNDGVVINPGGTFRIAGGSLTDEKVTTLTDYFGTPSGVAYEGGLNISFSSGATPPAGFTSHRVFSGDLANFAQEPVPTPTPTFTLVGPTSTPTDTPTQTHTPTPTDTPIPPVVTIESPADGSIGAQSPIEVSGQAVHADAVTVNGVAADLTGTSFTASVDLVEGANLITATATGPGGSAIDQITVYLDTAPPAAPDPERIIAWGVDGGEITVRGLAGSVEGSTQVIVTNTRTGQQVVVTAGADGSFEAVLAVIERDEITIVLEDAAGNPSEPTTIQVLPPSPQLIAPPVDRTVATTVFDGTAFLYTGPLAVQLGVAPETIVPERSAVVRGQVLDHDGEPAPGVKITVLGHPEYGYTLSRSDGAFDLAVNGGEVLTVQYERQDAFTVQRKLQVPWQDYAFLPEVILTEPDQQMTSIAFSPSEPLKTAEGSTEGQGTESRTGFLLFPPGVEVTTIFPGETEPRTSLDVRITEYTVDAAGPEAMPGELPPRSAYTYAFELSADEAIAAGVTRVDFTEPLPFYVENFIGFPVGMAVPLGSYNLEEARWEPAPNGRVLAVVSITDGVANLDADGDGDADAADEAVLEALGVTASEREQLAARYSPGQSLWRLSLSFFSRWDANWPGGAPNDAVPPNGGLPGGSNERDRLDDPDLSPSGNISFQNQALRQTAEVLGTPFTLTYQSDRQLDRATLNTMTIPLSGPTVPASLTRIEVEIQVAGRRFVETFPPLPNQSATFTWDGMDAYGRLLQGWQSVKAEVRFVYPRVYDQPAQDPAAFGLTSGVAISGFSNTRAEITSGVRFEGLIGGWDAKEEGLGGFSLDVHRSYDPISAMLSGGDGTERTSGQLEPVIRTVIGGGSVWPIVNGVTKATDVFLVEPGGVAVGADGQVYVSDFNVTRRRVFRLNPDGTLTTVAGGGSSTASGIPATQASLSGPYALAFGPDGALYVSERDGHRVRRVDLETGIITTVAGTGGSCSSNCGIPGPATQAGLNRPSGLALGPDGTLYIAHTPSGSHVLAVGTDGIIRRIAGGGPSFVFNTVTDGIPATQANFFNSGAIDLVLAPDGTLYVSSGFNRVRRVAPDGRVYTVAGTGTSGDTGDGLTALQATFNAPHGLALDSEGGLFIADRNAHRVRRLSPERIMTAVASKQGNGAGFTGERGPAPAAKLNNPNHAAVGPDGSLYVADTNNGRIRKVSSPLPGFATIGDTVIASRDGREVYVFNSRGKHLRTVDAITAVVKYEFGYDGEGRLASVTDASGNQTTIARSGNQVTITGPYGQTTTLTLDANGYVESITNPNNETTEFTSSSKGLLTSVTDPESHTSTFTYDESGRLIEAEYPPGSGSDTLTRFNVPVTNGSGYVVVHTTGEGVQTGYQVELLPTGDQRRTTFFPDGTELVLLIGIDGTDITTQATGLLQTVQQAADPRFGMQAPVDQTTTVTTPADNLTATITGSRTAALGDAADPFSFTTHTETVTVNGRPVTRTYDPATRTYADTSPEGRQTVTVLDADNRPILQQVGNLTATTFGYDPDGRLSGITQGTRVNTIAYDPDGNVESVTDSANRTVAFAYDGAGRVTTQTLPDLRTIGLLYDSKGNVTSITPPGRPAHTFAYTPASLPLIYAPPNVTPPLTDPRTRYQYNLSGQLIRIIRPDGQVLFLDYDLLTGDLITQVWPTGQRNFNYDQDTGNLELITFPGGSLTYGYDGSLLKTETWAGTIAGSVSRTYDNSFRVSRLSVNGANPIEFTYDNDDLLIATDNDPSTGPDDLILTRSPQTGLLTGTTLGVVTDSYGYNSFGEVTSYTASISGNPIFSVTYTRDALGRIEAKTEAIQGVTDTYEYGYDQAGRLTDVTKNSTPVAHYEYDSNGNRVPDADNDGNKTFNQAGTLLSATYDDQDRLVSSTLGPSTFDYQYTANGELLSKTDASGTTAYTNDVLGNLTHVELPNGDDIDYVIDGRERRIGKKVNNALVQGLLFDGQLTPVAELNGAGAIVGRFVYASKANVPDYVIRGTTTYRIVSDHLGSPRLVIDPSGTVVQRTDYDEFGNVLLEDVDPGFQRLPFGFAGGLYDPQTGLVRFGARDYDPETGRWTAKDPILFDGGDANLYAYAQIDPINRKDPFGLATNINLLGGLSLQNVLRSHSIINYVRLLPQVHQAAIYATLGIGQIVTRSVPHEIHYRMAGGLQTAMNYFNLFNSLGGKFQYYRHALGVHFEQYSAILRSQTTRGPVATLELQLRGASGVVEKVIKVRFYD